MKGFQKQLTCFMGLNAELYNIGPAVANDVFPGVVASSLTINGIQAGNVFDRNLPYKLGATTNAVGMINVADSMAAVKKLVFEEKKVSMKALKAALAANWQGEDCEKMRKMFLAAPKFGNDNDEVDAIAIDLYRFFAETAVTLNTWHGKKYNPAAISISAQWPGGALTGATPDGRYAGEVLADGSMSPMRGRDTCGPTAVIKSASKIDQAPYQGTLLNMKFHPSALQTTEDLKKLSALTRTYFSLGGKHIQFNIIDKETLIDAQEHPEKHRDLIVRIAGYSAYFVQLGKPIQDEVIGRMEHKLA